MLAWLSDTGSLTMRLVEACLPGRFSVEVVSQSWTRPLATETGLLGMRRGEVALTREVLLHCDGQPQVFARTLIPASSFTGKARRLAYLRSRPLGAVLFADPTTQRRTMQFARLTESHTLYQHACGDSSCKAAVLWGRRTLFYYANQPLLVNEIFLKNPDKPSL